MTLRLYNFLNLNLNINNSLNSLTNKKSYDNAGSVSVNNKGKKQIEDNNHLIIIIIKIYI